MKGHYSLIWSMLKLPLMKRSSFVILMLFMLALVPFLVITWYGWNGVRPKKGTQVLKRFPTDVEGVTYTISCPIHSTVYTMRVNYDGPDKSVARFAGVHIGSSPDDLEPFCGREIYGVVTPREEFAQPLCRPNKKCSDTKVPVVDIQKFWLKDQDE